MLPLEWIAGAIDCDGSISISETKRKTFNFVVNFRQLETAIDTIKEIQETLGVGKIYKHSSKIPANQKMLTWQTTTAEETLLVCRLLLPHLQIKRLQARNMINALELWESSKGRVQGTGFQHPEWAKDKVREIAKSMNQNNQTETRNRNKLDLVESLS